MDRLEILEQEVTNIEDKIVEHKDEIIRLEVLREVLRQEIELHKPHNTNNDELPF